MMNLEFHLQILIYNVFFIAELLIEFSHLFNEHIGVLPQFHALLSKRLLSFEIKRSCKRISAV